MRLLVLSTLVSCRLRDGSASRRHLLVIDDSIFLLSGGGEMDRDDGRLVPPALAILRRLILKLIVRGVVSTGYPVDWVARGVRYAGVIVR